MYLIDEEMVFEVLLAMKEMKKWDKNQQATMGNRIARISDRDLQDSFERERYILADQAREHGR